MRVRWARCGEIQRNTWGYSEFIQRDPKHGFSHNIGATMTPAVLAKPQ